MRLFAAPVITGRSSSLAALVKPPLTLHSSSETRSSRLRMIASRSRKRILKL